MSYTKHTWTNGEVVTAAKMNNIETGIEEASSGGGSGGGVLVVNMDENNALDKTWQEIHDGGFGIVSINGESDILYLPICRIDSVPFQNKYNVYALAVDKEAFLAQFTASSASGYPELQSGD